MNILFHDLTAPYAYDWTKLQTKGMGGAEGTVVRVATGLAAAGHSVRVAQKERRTLPITEQGVTYGGVGMLAERDWVPERVVVLRDAKKLLVMPQIYPRAKYFLWVHDLWGNDIKLGGDIDRPWLFGQLEAIRHVKPTLIAVSNFHKENIKASLSIMHEWKDVRIKVVYNAIDNDLTPDFTIVDPYKLVYFSSPHKGLQHGLACFRMLRQMDSRYRLCISNPGYLPSRSDIIPGVVNLGSLSHKASLQHVREALCVFYPNNVFPETFGLVFAEANAVGTPVVTYNLGAAYEILAPVPKQVVDFCDEEEVLKRVEYFRENHIRVENTMQQFRLSTVVKEWEKVLR